MLAIQFRVSPVLVSDWLSEHARTLQLSNGELFVSDVKDVMAPNDIVKCYNQTHQSVTFSAGTCSMLTPLLCSSCASQSACLLCRYPSPKC